MKSLRTSLLFSLILINVFVIMLFSSSILLGFFRMSSSWQNGITTDVVNIINRSLSDNFPELISLKELNENDYNKLLADSLTDLRDKLILISFYTTNNEYLYTYNFKNIGDLLKPIKPNPGIMKFISRIRFGGFKQHKDSVPKKMESLAKLDTGKLKVLTIPIMEYRYLSVFDGILTYSLVLGIVAAVIFSIFISFLTSRKLSQKSEIFALQITDLADGKRDINFISASTNELKASAKAAERLQNELKRNELLQQRWLQDIVHDLKNPIAALGIQFEALQDGLLCADRERIELLSAEFNILEEMISQLNMLTHFKSKSYIPQLEVFDLNSILDEIIQRFQTTALKSNNTLSVFKPDKLMILKSDRMGIIRVMNNLVINALNNTPENSTIRISASVIHHNMRYSGKIVVEVENPGRIDEEDLPFIFDRLYRSKKSGYKGSGLGLAISKTIIEKNGGSIRAINTPDSTVIFRVVLPQMAD